MGVEKEIEKLLLAGRRPSELVKEGYAKSTVYKVAKWLKSRRMDVLALLIARLEEVALVAYLTAREMDGLMEERGLRPYGIAEEEDENSLAFWSKLFELDPDLARRAYNECARSRLTPLAHLLETPEEWLSKEERELRDRWIEVLRRYHPKALEG